MVNTIWLTIVVILMSNIYFSEWSIRQVVRPSIETFSIRTLVSSSINFHLRARAFRESEMLLQTSVDILDFSGHNSIMKLKRRVFVSENLLEYL